MTNNFDHVAQVFRNLKNLSKDEARVFIEIVKMNEVTADSVKNILTTLNLTGTVSRPYQLLQNLATKGVVFQVDGVIPKTYKTISPAVLLSELRDDWNALEDEIRVLEEVRQVPMKEIDPREDSKVFKTENELITVIKEFLKGSFVVTIFLAKGQDSSRFKGRFAMMTKEYSTKIQFADTKDSNLVLLEHKEKNIQGVIFLSTYKTKDQVLAFYGYQILDNNVFDLVKRGVKNEKTKS